METGPYQLAEDVFACVSGGRFVFMDLRRNRYLCLSRRHSLAAAGILGESHPQDIQPSCVDGGVDETDPDAVLAALSQNGLLAGRGANARETPRRIQPVNRSLPYPRNGPRAGFRPAHLAAFTLSALTATGRLRWQSMHRSVLAIAARRHSRPHAAGDGAVSELVAIFHRLRPLYGRRYHCLFDSLALIEFLARYRRFPDWVFAVRSAPFAAHCWVQHDDCVLNDTVENVRGYTPIMAV